MNAIIPFFRGRERGSYRSGRRPANRRRSIMLVEALEGRQLLSNMYVVSNTSNSGAGSFAQAIISSNLHPSATSAPNTIDFDITGTPAGTLNKTSIGYYEIQPASALPAITAAVTIDATTQPGWAPQQLVVEIDGVHVDTGNPGLVIDAADVTVQGLSIYSFIGGVEILGPGATGDTLDGDWVGLDVNQVNQSQYGNFSYGVEVSAGASDATIGGTTAASLNVIAGNGAPTLDAAPGIVINGSSGNVVEGNHIGLSVQGGEAANTGDGVEIDGGASYNTVGGTVSGALNVISGNDGNGVNIRDAGTTGNVVEGNYIGTDVSGMNSLGNTHNGVFIDGGATLNTVGGTTAGARNISSGNGSNGVEISGDGTNLNLVEGNFTGTDVSGMNRLGNGDDGVFFELGATLNTVGGTTAGACNVISGNDIDGVGIINSGTDENLVEGNYIGTDLSGVNRLGNSRNGVFFAFGAYMNTVGGTAARARNIISGNGADGVDLSPGPELSLIAGNYIGTDVSGMKRLGNGNDGVLIASPFNTVGGSTSGASNVISGNVANGVELSADSAEFDLVEGNYIGTDVSGKNSVINGNDGVAIDDSATENTIGGSTSGASNVISGNAANGIEISDPGTESNLLEGNYVGTDSSGEHILGDGNDGVAIDDGATLNTVGGTLSGTIGGNTAFSMNVISGNKDNGVGLDSSSNVVDGNYIGLEPDGKTALGNTGDGVIIHNQSTKNTIGGSVAGAGNVISGNHGNGVNISGSGTLDNVVEGNDIGTNSQGSSGPGNSADGVMIQSGASSNTVGGTTAPAMNIISGNGKNGVELNDSSSDIVEGNDIGTDFTGTNALPNAGAGVDVDGESGPNTIGGTVAGSGNVISNNKGDGVLSESTDPTSVLSNSIYQNASGGIGFTGNTQVPAITLSNLAASGGKTTVGVAISDASLFADVLIEFFSSPSGGEGATLIDAAFVMTTPTGTFNNGSLALAVPPTPGGVLTATVTNNSGNMVIPVFNTTSEFSNALAVPAATATASFLKADTATQGNWEKVPYGAQGYDIVGGPSSLPSYTSVTPSGTSEYTWPTATAPQSLQLPGSSNRIAAVWYAATSFTVDVNLTDGNTHDLELYFLDYDSKGRAENVQISTSSGTVLSTESISSFSKGVYLNWTVSGNLVITITNTGPVNSNAVLNGVFIDSTTSTPPSGTAGPPGTASFIAADTMTQGTWEPLYGKQGYNIAGGPSSLPSTASVMPMGSSVYSWPTATAPQSLQLPNSSNRIAAVWYAPTSFTVDVNLTDGNTHDLELYFLDYDCRGRSENVQVSNTSGTVLSTQAISSFSAGEYLNWVVSGNLVITITNTSATAANAVLNGVFIDSTTTTPPSGTASFIKADTTTQGTWEPVFGKQGYDIAGGPSSLPSTASVTPMGTSEYTWPTATALQSLQLPGSNNRIAAAWYAATSFTVDVDFTDSNTHDLELYFLDYDSRGRSETVKVSTTGGTVLSTESISSFSAGEYLNWAVSGNVVITITNTSKTGPNAVLSGVFLS